MSNEEEANPGFAEVLSKAVQARGLSLDRIRARLEAAGVPVSNATLSYWQSGRSLPTRARSLRTLVELESILRLEPGTLIELIRTADGRTRHQLFDWQSVLPAREVAQQIIADWGLPGAGRLTRINAHHTTTVDQYRRETGTLTRQLMRAERSGVQSFPLVQQQEGGFAGETEIEPLFGCRVGRLTEVDEIGLVVAEMVLPRPLQRGEIVAVEFAVTMPAAQESAWMVRSIPEQCRELMLGVQFDPRNVPVKVEGFASSMIEHTSDEAEISDVVELSLFNGQAQQVRLEVAPGVYGIRWSWE